MAQQEYPKDAKPVSVRFCDDDPTRRTNLEVELLDRRGLNGEGRRMFVIMMNPAHANFDHSDRTINRVIRYVTANGAPLKDVKQIAFGNLYAVYEPDSKKLGDLVLKKGLDFVCGNATESGVDNDDVIREEVSKSSLVVAAWGKPSGPKKNIVDCKYRERVVDVLTVVSETIRSLKEKNKEVPRVCSFGILAYDNKYPQHPSRMANRNDLEDLNLDELILKMRSDIGAR